MEKVHARDDSGLYRLVDHVRSGHACRVDGGCARGSWFGVGLGLLAVAAVVATLVLVKRRRGRGSEQSLEHG